MLAVARRGLEATGTHHFEGFYEVGDREAVGDDGAGIETGTDHGAHLIPGLKQLAAIDAFEDEAFEDDFVPVDLEALREDAEEGHLGPVRGVREDIAQVGRMAGHFEANVEAFIHPEFLFDVGEGFLADVYGARRAWWRARDGRD